MKRISLEKSGMGHFHFSFGNIFLVILLIKKKSTDLLVSLLVVDNTGLTNICCCCCCETSSGEEERERELCSQEMESKEKRNWQKTVNNCPFPQTTKKEVTEKWTYYLNFRWETLTVMASLKRKLDKDPLSATKINLILIQQPFLQKCIENNKNYYFENVWSWEDYEVWKCIFDF